MPATQFATPPQGPSESVPRVALYGGLFLISAGTLLLELLHTRLLSFMLFPSLVYIVVTFVMAVFVLATVNWLARLADVPKALLTPVILTFCVVGSYALANRVFDVWVMLAFGLVGFALERMQIPLAPFVIGLVLAPLAEEHLSAGLMQTGGSYMPLVTSPIALVCLLLSLVILVGSLWRSRRAPA